LIGHSYIILAAFFTALSQLILKYQINLIPDFPQGLQIAPFVFKLIFTNVWIMTCVVSTICASLCWIGAVSKFQLSMAFPYFSGLTFVVVTGVSIFLFSDVVSWYKIAGIVMILAGILVIGLD